MKISRFISVLTMSFLVVTSLSPAAHALRVVEEQVILDKIDDYQLCQKKDYSGDFCHDALKRWVEKNPTDAFKAGKMTRLAMNHWVAIPFFSQAFAAKQGQCKDQDVSLAVVSALGLPGDSNKEVVAQAKDIAFNKCYDDLKVTLLKEMPADGYMFANACKDLLDKKVLTGLKAAKCKTIK